FDIWQSFQNQYWPALYLIDAKGQPRYQKFGEGDYREIELQIRKLLQEASGKNISTEITEPLSEGYEAGADWENLESPENYLGYGRTAGFASPGGVSAGKKALYIAPDQLKLNQWALAGEWY